jgi:hypothetical protein
LQIEVVSGNYSDNNYPMAINRSFFSDFLRANWGKEYEVDLRKFGLYIDQYCLDIELNIYYGGSQKDHKGVL